MADKPRLKSDWAGRYVRLRYRIETKGGAIFRAGSILQVDRNYGGLDLATVRRCPTCEAQFRRRVAKVSEQDVELLPRDYRPAPDEPPFDEQWVQERDDLRAALRLALPIVVAWERERVERYDTWLPKEASAVEEIQAIAARYNVQIYEEVQDAT